MCYRDMLGFAVVALNPSARSFSLGYRPFVLLSPQYLCNLFLLFVEQLFYKRCELQKHAKYPSVIHGNCSSPTLDHQLHKFFQHNYEQAPTQASWIMTSAKDKQCPSS